MTEHYIMLLLVLIVTPTFLLCCVEAFPFEQWDTPLHQRALLRHPSGFSTYKGIKRSYPSQRRPEYEPKIQEKWVPPPNHFLDPQEVPGVAVLSSTNDGHINYMANVTLGNQTFELILDTASSTTWVIQENFTCISKTSHSSEWGCRFGPAFQGTFAQNRSIEGKVSSLRYGNGDSVWGEPGYMDISIGTLSVPHQQVCKYT
jgi:hypothetical protein